MLFENEKISINEANEIWDKMIIKNRTMPSKTFLKYYRKVYSEDKKDFGYKLNYNLIK